jgi:hypothetical protein
MCRTRKLYKTDTINMYMKEDTLRGAFLKNLASIGVLQVNQPVKSVIHFEFATKRELAKTFIRFQEHYESPQFRGLVFTLAQYKAWYLLNAPNAILTKKFTYYEDWGGFNIPNHVLEPFFMGKFNPLTQREKRILEYFEPLRHKKVYIIGTCIEEKNLLKHEIAHGLYYTNSAYKKQVKIILSRLQKEFPLERKKIRQILKNSGGYHTRVLDDETHAYLLTDKVYLKKLGVRVDLLSEIIVLLNKVYATTYAASKC